MIILHILKPSTRRKLKRKTTKQTSHDILAQHIMCGLWMFGKTKI